MMEKNRKPPGLLILLDEEIKLTSSGSDRKFLSKIGKIHSNNRRLKLKSVKDKNMLDTEFWIKHYAGNVKYNVIGFMDKSRDELFRNISEVIEKSKIHLVSNVLWGQHLDYDGRPKNESKNKRSSQSSKKMTLSGQFRKQLINLMNTLSEAKPHYIRCIKPNGMKKPKIFDGMFW